MGGYLRRHEAVSVLAPGSRSGATALDFLDDLKGRLANWVQLTADGHKRYLEAVKEAFKADVDYAMLVKLYGAGGSEGSLETRISPPDWVGTRTEISEGDPDEGHIATSYVKRRV